MNHFKEFKTMKTEISQFEFELFTFTLKSLSRSIFSSLRSRWTTPFSGIRRYFIFRIFLKLLKQSLSAVFVEVWLVSVMRFEELKCVCLLCGSIAQQRWSVWRSVWPPPPTVSVCPECSHTALLRSRTPSPSQSSLCSQTLKAQHISLTLFWIQHLTHTLMLRDCWCVLPSYRRMIFGCTREAVISISLWMWALSRSSLNLSFLMDLIATWSTQTHTHHWTKYVCLPVST